MKDFLLGLAYLVGVLLVLRLIGRLLIKWVYWPLEKFCGERGLNPSPWGFTIWEGIMVYEYLSRTGYELFFKNWIYSRWMTSAGYGWAILALAALPMVVMLVQSRVIYFIPWLLTKLIGIPFFFLAFFVGMPKTDEETANEKLSRELDRAAERGISVPQKGSSYRRNRQEPEPSGGGSEDVPRRVGIDPNGPYWADPEPSAPPAHSGTSTYQSEYRHFDSGDDSREYDSDYTPMD